MPPSPYQPPQSDPAALAAEGYWDESRQPLTSLVFIAPLLVIYEAAVLLLGTDAVRNGAEVWLRQFLDLLDRYLLDLGQYFLLPVLTVCTLLGWHYTTRRPWRVRPGLLAEMAGECVVLAVILRLLAQLLHMVPWLSISSKIGLAAGFLGAGIYEELLFRLILLSLVTWGLKRLKVEEGKAIVVAVLLTSLLFSAAHYIGPHGDELQVYSFLFRSLAGVFFSVLFLCRGFGIAVGTHAGYDLLVGLF